MYNQNIQYLCVIHINKDYIVMLTKICKKCGISKETYEFGILKKNTDGLRDVCKVCKSFEDAKYRENNKEKVVESKQKWASKNPNHKKEYYLKNKEKLKKESRIFYEKNKLRYNLQSKLWNKTNVDKRREIIKKHKEIPEIKLKEKIRHRFYLFLKSKNIKKKYKYF